MSSATIAPDDSGLVRPAPGSHVCWIVDDDSEYSSVTEAFLRNAAETDEKAVLIGPTGSSDVARLGSLAGLSFDPYVAVFDRRAFEPAKMFAAFRNETARARAEGFARLRVMADMDWLVPTGADAATIQAFELMLGRHARTLDATIVCAYRSSRIDRATIRATACVHPTIAGLGDPPFRMVSGDDGWKLSGEVDAAVEDEFAVALATAAADDVCVLDVTQLEFIDARGMTRLGQLAGARPLVLRGAAPTLRRHIQLACTREEAASISFAD